MKALLMLFSIYLFASSAQAGIINEVGDAGQTLSTSQTLAAGTTQVNGLISSGTDVDMYTFGWGGGTFLAEGLICFTGTCPYGDPDGYLWLFDSLGAHVASNDDGGQGFLPRISLANLQTGVYNIAYGGFDQSAVYSSGVVSGFTGIAWEAPFNYRMSISATSSEVPEPSIIALFAVGLVGIGFARRRKA